MLDCKYLIDSTKDDYEKKKSIKKFDEYAFEDALNLDDAYVNAKYAYKTAVFEKERSQYNGDAKKAAEWQLKAEKAKYAIEKELNKHQKSEKAPDCPVCHDEGFVNGQYCKCFIDKLTGKAYNYLGITRPFLSSFRDDVFSAENNTKTLITKLEDYCETFSKGKKNFLLFGAAGTGKTFLAQSTVKTLEEKGYNPLFITSFKLNDIAVEAFRRDAYYKTISDEILSGCDFLVIDDLGSEPVYNKITVETLLNVISRRLENQKPFMITTNLTTDELLIRYGERLFSRITGKNTVILKIDGKDLRKFI